MLMSSFCHAHIKWAKTESIEEGKIQLTFSESMVPFVAERKFISGEIKIRNGDKMMSVTNSLRQQIQSNTMTTLVWDTDRTFSSVVLEPIPVTKRAKIERFSGRSLPHRVEWSRLSVIQEQVLSDVQMKPAAEQLDAVPVFTGQHTGKVNDKYRIQVYRDGLAVKPSNVLIFDATANAFIVDHSVSAQGLVEFTPKSAGYYLFQTDELVFAPGMTGVADIAHNHLFASLIFTIRQ